MIIGIARTLLAFALFATSGIASAQVSNIPFPASQSLNGSVGASVILEPGESSAVVLTNTRGSNVTARLTDFILTNGGSATCYVHFAYQNGDIALGELAVPPGQTLVVNVGNGVPVGFGASFRAVRSDLFGAACNTRLVISIRGWFTAAN